MFHNPHTTHDRPIVNTIIYINKLTGVLNGGLLLLNLWSRMNDNDLSYRMEPLSRYLPLLYHQIILNNYCQRASSIEHSNEQFDRFDCVGIFMALSLGMAQLTLHSDTNLSSNMLITSLVCLLMSHITTQVAPVPINQPQRVYTL